MYFEERLYVLLLGLSGGTGSRSKVEVPSAQKLISFTAWKPREEGICYYFHQFLCFYPAKTKSEIFYIRMYYAPLSMPNLEGGSLYRWVSNKLLSKLVNLKMIYQHFKFRNQFRAVKIRLVGMGLCCGLFILHLF